MITENLKKLNGVYIPGDWSQITNFEEIYLSVRKKEQRVYSNQEILHLPDIDVNHQHYQEWCVRKESCKRLLTYLKKKQRFLNILEVGCGIGWLSHKLAEIPQTEVIGLDINLSELQQAANVFTNSNLQFVCGDFREDILQKTQFDIVIFAASIQYFPSLNEIINLALENLAAKGEIHIIDSFLYNNKNVETAKQRCREYYRNIGFPEMANYFFHHLQTDLSRFNCIILQHQNSFFNKLILRKNIFPWLCIKNDDVRG